MLEVTPDRSGYVEAQNRLREVLGEAVILIQPAVNTYPPGTALDPETGEPYDPLIQPTSSAAASALIQGRVAERGVAQVPERATNDGALGWMEDNDVAVIAASAAASAADGATGMVIRGERYVIRSTRFDGLTGIERLLIFGEKEST